MPGQLTLFFLNDIAFSLSALKLSTSQSKKIRSLSYPPISHESALSSVNPAPVLLARARLLRWLKLTFSASPFSGVKFRPCSLKERAFNQHRFRGALLVRSAGDWRAIGVEAHVLFVRTGADASHHKRSITGIAELIVATRRQNNGLVLARL